MDTFSEASYYLNVSILVSFDHHTCSNIIATALGLEALLSSVNQGSASNALAVHWNHAGATLKEELDISEGLNVVPQTKQL